MNSAVEWLIDESMKLVVQYMQGTLNEDTLDGVIYEIGTKAKEMEKQQIIKAVYDSMGEPIELEPFEDSTSETRRRV